MNPDLAASWWAEFVEIRLELGPITSWNPTGALWGVAEWGTGDLWGSGYLTPATWLDVTGDAMSFDSDTGRNGVDDPGEVGTATLVLHDPTGEYGVSGGKERIGNLLRATVTHLESGVARHIFYGKVTEAKADESLSAPTITLRAADILGAVMGTDDGDPLPAQAVSDRLNALLDRAGFPASHRLIDPDTVHLLPTEKVGNRMDAARGAVESSPGGTLYAPGDGTIRYDHGATNIDPDAVPRFRIGTAPGYVCPTGLVLVESASLTANLYDWTNIDNVTPLRVTLQEPHSVNHYGRQANVRTDLVNAQQSELEALVESELARTAWPGDAIETCTLDLWDSASAELCLVQIGDLLDFDYTGADPFTGWQLCGRYAHHVSPDAYTLDIGAYAPTVGALWGVGRWGVSAWAS